MVKNLHANKETPEMRVHSLGQLKEEMETHFSILAWKIPGTEEVHGLQSMKLQSWTPLSAHTHTHTQTYTHIHTRPY